MGSSDDETRDRLVRLEESVGFGEHTVEQLSTEIASMNERVHRLERRLERLTSRLDELLAGPDEVPPEDSDQE